MKALNNVAIHAQASAVEVEIKRLPDWICLTITDDGKSFDVKRVLRTKGNGRLGLLGMRERLEMGRWQILDQIHARSWHHRHRPDSCHHRKQRKGCDRII
jgi:signal transduction histidine kinase